MSRRDGLYRVRINPFNLPYNIAATKQLIRQDSLATITCVKA